VPIRAWQYRDGTACAELAGEAAFAAIGTHDESSLLWVDLDVPTPSDITRIGDLLGVHHLSVEDLINRGQRTKLERYDDHSHVALRECRFDPDEKIALVSLEVDLIFGPGWIVSLREEGDQGEAPASIDDARARFERQRREHGSTDEGFVVWAIIDSVVDRYFEVVEQIDDRLDDLEEAVFESDGMAMMSQDAYKLRRSMLTFRRAVTPLREVLAVILRREIASFGSESITHLQDVNDHVLRILDLLETQRELLADLRDAQLSIASNRMNRVMKATSSWGAILVVNTVITGVYGMNFRHMPELGWYALVTFVLYRVFRRRDWL
jgi:magnesium transporter